MRNTLGWAITRQSKYTSVPSRKVLGSRDVPKRTYASGTSEIKTYVLSYTFAINLIKKPTLNVKLPSIFQRFGGNSMVIGLARQIFARIRFTKTYWQSACGLISIAWSLKNKIQFPVKLFNYIKHLFGPGLHTVSVVFSSRMPFCHQVITAGGLEPALWHNRSYLRPADRGWWAPKSRIFKGATGNTRF